MDPPAGTETSAPASRGLTRRRARLLRWAGAAFRSVTTVVALGLVALLAGLVVFLLRGAEPSIVRFGPGFLSGTAWDVPQGIFGALPPLEGTLITSGLALLLAVPIALGVALFASEMAPRWLRGPVGYVIDLGAAVPSVVYGFWAIVVLVPFLSGTIEPGVARLTGGVGPFAGPPRGTDLLAAGLILAIMIVPTIAALAREALRSVPRDLREAALGVGATRWEATRLAVLGPAAPGLVGAVILGFARAIGETIAVALVIGNEYQLPSSLFSRGVTIPSWIVNAFSESYGITLSSLYELAALLLVVSVAINLGARLLIGRWERRRGRGHRWRRGTSGLATGTTAPGSGAPRPWFAAVIAARARRLRRRRVVQALVLALVVGAVALAAWPLASVIGTAVANGGRAVVTPSFYTSEPPPPCGIGQAVCPVGGIGPEIQGTFIMVGLAAAVALPAGLLAGIYLAEYARRRVGTLMGLVVDVLLGVPTILIGVFVFSAFLTYDRLDDQSAFAGAAALAVLMLPIVAKSTELALRTVPETVREGALALGFPRHRVTLRVVLGSCRSALVTGLLLAIMRAAGETAAVLFTAGSSVYWATNLRTPIGAIAPFIYDALTVYTSSNYGVAAWGAALVLLLMMAAVTLAARLAVRRTDAQRGT